MLTRSVASLVEPPSTAAALSFPSERVGIVLENLLRVLQSLQDSLLTDDFRDIADRRADGVPRDRVPEKEEHILVLVAEVRLLVLLEEVHRAGFVQVKSIELSISYLTQDVAEVGKDLDVRLWSLLQLGDKLAA